MRPLAGACEPSGGVVPSRRALRARIENAPHSRGKRPKPKKADTGDHNAPVGARDRPYGYIMEFNGSGISYACDMSVVVAGAPA